MLPARRPFHSTQSTANIVGRFPSWMKIRQTDSNGYKLVDALIGNEVELFTATYNAYSKYFFIDTTPIDAMTSLMQLELPFILKDTIIYSNNIGIKVVENSLEFLTNPPTRINLTDYKIYPSGLNNSNIVGLEFISSYPESTLVVKTSLDDIIPSSLLYYNCNSNAVFVDPIPTSGISLGIDYVGLGMNGLYELAMPESEWSLRRKYPEGVWITASGTTQSTIPSGIFWKNQSFIDIDTNTKTYYKQALNNPYGSGVYNQADITLVNTPIDGTIKIYDDYNLTSGVPTLIPSTGINVYGFVSGVWEYKGYENPIPWDIVPTDIADAVNYVPITPTLVGRTSWRILPSGGYIDDEVYPHNGTFNWIDGTGLTNTIRMSGGFSKYEVHYAYKTYNNITQLSADPKLTGSYASPIDSIMHFIDSEEYTTNLHYNSSDTVLNALRIDPTELRPGSIIYYTILMNTRLYDRWYNAQTVDKTIQFYNHNMGYTDEMGIING